MSASSSSSSSSSASTTNKTSFFEQVGIIRGGSTGIFGSSVKGLQWGLFAADFLLVKALLSSRFEMVVVLNMDRRQDDLLAVAQAHGGDVRKLRFVSWQPGLTAKHLVESIQSTVQQHRQSETNSAKSSVAIFVFSVSELCLLYGFRDATWLIKTLANIDRAPSTYAERVHSVVGVIHDSLHRTTHSQYFQGLFNTIVTLLPNDGMLASTVLGQIQCIRKSPTTGKFYENSELFSQFRGVLSPIPSNKADALSSSSQSNAETEDAQSKLVNELMGAASPTDEKSSTDKNNKTVEPSGPMSRLIAFDSTDPEFDEDSDPDNDLDL
jgi:hypothetical protein